MKLVKQTRYGPKGGDAWQACLATILCVPISSIPLWLTGNYDDFYKECKKWLWEEHERLLLSVPAWMDIVPVKRPHIVTGLSYGKIHATVFVGEVEVYDPHIQHNILMMQPETRHWLIFKDNIPEDERETYL